MSTRNLSVQEQVNVTDNLKKVGANIEYGRLIVHILIILINPIVISFALVSGPLIKVPSKKSS